jgi:hypothetical protein
MGMVSQALTPKDAKNAEIKVSLTDETITIVNANTTIGYARYSKLNRLVEYVFVHPAFRRMGYGRLMIGMLEGHVGSELRPEPPISPLGRFLFHRCR